MVEGRQDASQQLPGDSSTICLTSSAAVWLERELTRWNPGQNNMDKTYLDKMSPDRMSPEKCHQTKCHRTKCHQTKCHRTNCHWTNCHWTECHWTKCHWTECHWTECYQVVTQTNVTCDILSRDIYIQIPHQQTPPRPDLQEWLTDTMFTWMTTSAGLTGVADRHHVHVGDHLGRTYRSG